MAFKIGFKITPLIAILFLIINKSIYSEYRAYQYYVRNTNQSTNSNKLYIINSTLDPISYQAYHGGINSVSIDLLRSWMCFGDTSFRAICPPPLAKEMQSEKDL